MLAQKTYLHGIITILLTLNTLQNKTRLTPHSPATPRRESTQESLCATRTMPEEPKSWAELLQSSRKSCAPAPALEQQTRFTRTVPGVTSLAEGGAGQALTHTPNAADGSLQRSQWHGWGCTSLLKQDAPPKQLQQQQQQQQKPQPASGMFGLLQGTDAGGVDSWIGNPQIDPTKGKRALRPAPPERGIDMTQLLAQTAPPCSAGASGDAWLGNIKINPARGKGHAADPAALRGRTGLASILQQSVLREDTCAHPAADEDAWLGNRLIQPGKGRRPVSSSPAAAAALHGATFSRPPPAEACWCDMPRIGRRPLPPPSALGNAITAAQTLAMEVPLPLGAVVGPRKPAGKQMIHHAAASSTVPISSLLTARPLSGSEQERWRQAWDDAAAQTRKRLLRGAAASGVVAPGGAPIIVRRVPHTGGIAQEVGQSLDDLLAHQKRWSRRSGGAAAASAASVSGGGAGGGRLGAAQGGRRGTGTGRTP